MQVHRLVLAPVGVKRRSHGVSTTGPTPAVEELDHPQEAEGEIPHRVTQFPVSPDLHQYHRQFPTHVKFPTHVINVNIGESCGINAEECRRGRVVSSWRSCGPFCCSWDWCGCGGSTLCTANTNVRLRHRERLSPHPYL